MRTPNLYFPLLILFFHSNFYTLRFLILLIYFLILKFCFLTSSLSTNITLVLIHILFALNFVIKINYFKLILFLLATNLIQLYAVIVIFRIFI